LIERPQLVIAILDRLCDDPHDNVRNSVANSLNDIAKDHPKRAIATAVRWRKTGGQHVDWVVKRGLRTLIKSGDRDALRLSGFDLGSSVVLSRFKLNAARARLGGSVAFEFA
jgi:3-methyladenine DNA glycosylase AlkC